MSDPRVSSPEELIAAIDRAWARLEAFLSAVTDERAQAKDPQGWSVKDHSVHMAVWEDSVSVLFRGGRRHEALGIDEALYGTATFDEINEIIRERHPQLPLQDVIAMLRAAHDALMPEVRELTPGELLTPVSDFFPQAPRGDDRAMATFIFENTANHFNEHLEWMRALVERAD